jgi:hypothetical protein
VAIVILTAALLLLSYVFAPSAGGFWMSWAPAIGWTWGDPQA